MLKWFIPLDEVKITEDPEEEPKETKPANLVSLKTTASSLRDTIKQSERELIWSHKKKFDGKNLDKLRRNLGQIEAQMVLALPHLLLQVNIKERSSQFSIINFDIRFQENLGKPFHYSFHLSMKDPCG